MKGRRVNCRSLLLGMALAPAVVRAARAAPMTLRLSSSLPNDPQFANGRVYYDNLVKRLEADGLADQIDVQFFPDNQLGQEIDVINSVKLGVIDLMVSGTSISANLVPLDRAPRSRLSVRELSASRQRRSTAARPSRSRRRC